MPICFRTRRRARFPAQPGDHRGGLGGAPRKPVDASTQLPRAHSCFHARCVIGHAQPAARTSALRSPAARGRNPAGSEATVQLRRPSPVAAAGVGRWLGVNRHFRECPSATLHGSRSAHARCRFLDPQLEDLAGFDAITSVNAGKVRPCCRGHLRQQKQLRPPSPDLTWMRRPARRSLIAVNAARNDQLDTYVKRQQRSSSSSRRPRALPSSLFHHRDVSSKAGAIATSSPACFLVRVSTVPFRGSDGTK